MGKRYLSESQIADLCGKDGVAQSAFYSLTAPVPQVLLVTVDRDCGEANVCVRTATMSPVSWRPYTKAICLPDTDEKVTRCLSAGAQCVLGLPSRHMLRQLTICRQRLPRGISEADVARLRLYKSLFVDVPSIQDCPVNIECVVDEVGPYHAHHVAFVRVVGASIDDSYLFWDRRRIIETYPTNFADEVVDSAGARRMRVSLLSDIHTCPTFPLTGKGGWCSSSREWMKDLADEGYLQEADRDRIVGWFDRWEEIFDQVGSPERIALREKLHRLSCLLAGEKWQEIHHFLSGQ